MPDYLVFRYSVAFKNIFILIFLTLLNINAFSQSLSGNYTIGGTSPDYETLNDAVNALNTNGVSGPVTFKIRSGIYKEQIEISEFSGSSDSNRVIFQSETGRQEDVVIQHMHDNWSTDVNFTISIIGADYLVFKNLTISAVKDPSWAADYNRVIYITENSNNISFENNIIRSWYVAADDAPYHQCVFVGTDYNTSTLNDSISFTKNTIIGGHHGISIQGYYGETEVEATKYTIENNIFREQCGGGLYMLYTKNASIKNNKFYSTNKFACYYTGISIENHADSLLIDGNYLNLAESGTGILITGTQSGETNFQQVSNNAIVINLTETSRIPIGISSTYNDTLLIANNSVNLNYADTTVGYCIYSSNDTMLLYNNQLVNKGGGLCYRFKNSQIESNYNNLYNYKNKVARIDNDEYNAVSDIFSDLGTDKNSLSVNPLFLNDTILIPYNAAVYNVGKPLSKVVYDFYGTKRSTTPDIGIYEGSIPANDVGLVLSNLTNSTFCPGDSIPLYVTIKNFGTNTLTTANIQYSWNNKIFSKITWNGSLNKLKEDDSILLGYITVKKFESVKLKAWAFSPNNQKDDLKYNDTLYISSVPPMNGNYTIADTAGNFSTLNEAVEALKQYGVCGPVTFNIKSGTYKEQITIPPIKGASVTNVITFQSVAQDSSKVILKFNGGHNYSNNFIIKLDGAQYIKIKHISLFTDVQADMANILFSNNASNNIITNNILTGIYNSQGSALIYMPEGSKSNNNIISNNLFKKAGYQVNISGSNEYPCEGNSILGNYFSDVALQSIYISYQKNVTITGNTLIGTRANLAISLSNCSGNIEIQRNKINLSTNAGGGALALFYCDGARDTPIIFANNFVTLSAIYGCNVFMLQNVSHFKALNNSFNLLHSQPIFAGLYSVKDVYLYNNIYNAVENEEAIFYTFDIGDTAEIHSDYNVFNTTADKNFTQNNFYYDIKEWRTNFNNDKNSIFIDPLYLDSADLHINNSKALNNTGLLFDEVTVDIDGEARNKIKPDIGADEYNIDSTQYYDLLLYKISNPDTLKCQNTDSLAIDIVNLSKFPITSFYTTYKLFNQPYKPQFWTDTILPLDTFQANLGYFPFAPHTLYDFQINVYKPNNKTDNYSLDNTLNSKYLRLNDIKILIKPTSLCDSTTTELYIPHFPRASVKWSTGSTDDKIIVTSPGTYSITVKGIDGCVATDSITIK